MCGQTRRTADSNIWTQLEICVHRIEITLRWKLHSFLLSQDEMCVCVYLLMLLYSGVCRARCS